jgi:hypothetical protein
VVLTARPAAPAPTLIVPDEQTWTLSGSDPAADGLRPVFVPGEARRLLVPEVLPAPLDEALESCLAALPAEIDVETRVLPGLGGRPVASVIARDEAGSADAHAGAHTAAHGDHDMQAGLHSHGGDDERSGHAVPAGHGTHDVGDDSPSKDEMDGGGHGVHGGHDAMYGGHDAMHGGHDAMHGGHDAMHGGHQDMMAIVGEPSADGLVMEPIELRSGGWGRRCREGSWST